MSVSMRLAYAFEGLGASAAALDQPERAARLLGAADAILTSSSTSLQEFEGRRSAEVKARLRGELGSAALAAAIAAGASMRPEDAAAFALVHFSTEEHSAEQ